MDVVEGGSGPDRPYSDSRNDQRLLRLIALGVLLIAVFTGLASWNLYRQTEMTRTLNCEAISIRFTEGETTNYDDLEPYAKKMADALDCDIPGR